MCMYCSDIPEAVRPSLIEALSEWRKAEAKRDSDATLAKMSYSRAASECSVCDVCVDWSLNRYGLQGVLRGGCTQSEFHA